MCIFFSLGRCLLPGILSLLWMSASFAQVPEETLMQRTLKGATCTQSVHHGLLCEYKVGSKLSFGIKNGGDSNEVIVFWHSDIHDDYYAALQSGCIAVVPGVANEKKYDKRDGAFIMPKSGLVHRTLAECHSAYMEWGK